MRLIFGATSVVAIFVVAMAGSSLMWAGRWLIARAEARRRKA